MRRTAFSCLRDSSMLRAGRFPKASAPASLPLGPLGLPGWLPLLLNRPATAPAALAKPALSLALGLLMLLLLLVPAGWPTAAAAAAACVASPPEPCVAARWRAICSLSSGSPFLWLWWGWPPCKGWLPRPDAAALLFVLASATLAVWLQGAGGGVPLGEMSPCASHCCHWAARSGSLSLWSRSQLR